MRIPAVANRTNMIFPHALAFSPDSRTLVGIGPTTTRCWGGRTGGRRLGLATGAVMGNQRDRPDPVLGNLRRQWPVAIGGRWGARSWSGMAIPGT